MMFNQYPYLNVNDLNLDYILAQIKTMMNEVTNFVSINAIKYADPIQWDITRQYEKNTVVIDPVTGTAYISVAPVPAGVALTRPEYWTVVFDLGSFVTRAAQNFTSHYEQDTTLTATFPSNTGDWLVWGDVLYKVISPIVAGDTYVVGSNIEHFTIEDIYDAMVNDIELEFNNLRGSIGVNELDSTVATVSIPAGMLVWIGGTLYATLTAINVGDSFIVGTNIAVARLDSYINNRVNNSENRVRGSIGVNELNSTTATQNFTAGVLVWVGGQLYMTLTPLNSGDAFVVGTNITPVTVCDYILNRLNNGLNELRGALAINELGSSTATVAISDGHLVWLDGRLAMTLTNISIGDTFTEGVNIAYVHIDNYILDRIAVLVGNELDKFDTSGYKVANKKFVFVGDSFGDSSNRGFNCWPEIFAADLGLSVSQWTNLCTDSAGIWNSTPSLTFLYQLQNYAGDKNEVTDIIIGEATNDSFNPDPNSSQYTAVKTYFKDIVDYVNANYPNATLYVASIGNGIDVSPNIGVRVYAARSAFRKNLFEWCGEYGVKILSGCEYALCGGLTWFLADQIHPNLTGETKLGNAISRAYLSKNANIMYWYKDEYEVYGGNPNFTNSGTMTSSVEIQNGETNTRIFNIGVLVTQGYTINQDFPLLGSPNIWYNEDVTVFGYIRLHGFDSEAERVLPCDFIFRQNTITVHIYDIDNGNFITSWTADAGAFITVNMISASTNTDRIV